jgi:hypothetical protein
MKKIILTVVTLFFSFSSFVNAQVFICNEQSIAQIMSGNKATTEGFLTAVSEYKKANEDLTEKVNKQNFTREFYDVPSLELEESKEEARVLQKRISDLDPCLFLLSYPF